MVLYPLIIVNISPSDSTLSVPAGIWRLNDVEVTSMQRYDVNSTSFKRHIFARVPFPVEECCSENSVRADLSLRYSYIQCPPKP